jgi:aminoglycoside phosphotransferase (APT) family kinase protein
MVGLWTVISELMDEVSHSIQINQPQVVMGTPASDLEIDGNLIYRLLAEQHPDLAHLPIYPVDVGWDNAMFRLGEQFCVRLPRRKAAASLIEHEQTWLPLLAEQLPIPVPVPLRIGTQSQDYPWRWSVLPWLPGRSADQSPPDANQAELFGLFLNSLHQPAPPHAPQSPVRGVPLSQRAKSIEERMQRLEAKTRLITEVIKSTWQAALQAPIDSHGFWLHGDLHPRNVLVQYGVITGIIDWGDITSGDAATDLASIWMLFSDRKDRLKALAAYGEVSTATLLRAKGWAILFGVLLVDTGLIDHPRHRAMGEKILNHVSQDINSGATS